MAHDEPTFSLGYTNRYRTSLFLPRPQAFTEPPHSIIGHILEGLAHVVPPLPCDGEIRFTANVNGKLVLTWQSDSHPEFIEDMEFLTVRGALDLHVAFEILKNYPYDVGVNQLRDRMPIADIIDCMRDPNRIRVVPSGYPGRDGVFFGITDDEDVRVILISGFPTRMPMSVWGNEQLQQRFWQKLTMSFGQAPSADA